MGNVILALNSVCQNYEIAKLLPYYNKAIGLQYIPDTHCVVSEIYNNFKRCHNRDIGQNEGQCRELKTTPLQM